MDYLGKLYGKFKGKYLELEMTAGEVEEMQKENERLKQRLDIVEGMRKDIGRLKALNDSLTNILYKEQQRETDSGESEEKQDKGDFVKFREQ